MPLGISVNALSPAHSPHCAGKILCFCLDPLHACTILRVLLSHCGRALVPEKGQWMSFWSPSAWCHPAYSQTASVCCSSQQPFSLQTLWVHCRLGVLLSRLSPLDPCCILLMVSGYLEIMVSSEQWSLLCMELLVLSTPARMRC